MRLKNNVTIIRTESGAFLLDAKHGVYWHLNATALALIEVLDKDDAIELAVSKVCAASGSQPDAVRGDYLSLVRELRCARLVEGRLT